MKTSVLPVNNYGITAEEFLTPVLLSLRVAFIALILSFVFGTMMAHFMTRKKFKGKIILETIIMLPIVLPPTVVGFILIVIFGNNGFAGNIVEWIFSQSIIYVVCSGACEYRCIISAHVPGGKNWFFKYR